MFYFDVSGDNRNAEFYEQGFLSSFIYWMHLGKGNLEMGCVGIIPGDGSMDGIKRYFLEENRQIKLAHNGLCMYPGEKYINVKDLLYDPKDFYTFRLKDKQIIDTRIEMFKKLGFSTSLY